MGFKIVKGDPTEAFWCSTDGASTYRLWQIVSFSAASKAAMAGTVKPLAVPAGVADTTNFQMIAGIVVGISDQRPISDSTGQYAAGVLTQAAQIARNWMGVEGMYGKDDPQLFVQVMPIYPWTWIEGPIFNAALGTAPTVVSDTGGADSTGYTTAGTTGACDFTPVANVASIYCRKGANIGMIRTTNDTSTTAPDVTVAFPYDVALGDQFVRVPLKQGLSHIYIDGPGMYIDCSKTPATHTFEVFVRSMNLEKAGEETAQFRFTNPHFDYARA